MLNRLVLDMQLSRKWTPLWYGFQEFVQGMSWLAIQTGQWMAISTGLDLCLSFLWSSLYCWTSSLGLLFSFRFSRLNRSLCLPTLQNKDCTIFLLPQVSHHNPLLLRIHFSLGTLWSNFSYDRSDSRCFSRSNSNNTNDAIHDIFRNETDLLAMQTIEMSDNSRGIPRQ